MPRFRVLWNEWISCAADVDAKDEDEAYEIARAALPRRQKVKKYIIACDLEDIKEIKKEDEDA